MGLVPVVTEGALGEHLRAPMSGSRLTAVILNKVRVGMEESRNLLGRRRTRRTLLRQILVGDLQAELTTHLDLGIKLQVLLLTLANLVQWVGKSGIDHLRRGKATFLLIIFLIDMNLILFKTLSTVRLKTEKLVTSGPWEGELHVGFVV